MKKTTKLAKVFNSYANNSGQDIKALRFVTPDGDRVSPTAYETMTVGGLDLEDGDSIDVFIEQVGGVAGSCRKCII